MPAWQEKVAKAVHGLLLLATLAMPLSGIAMNIGGGRALEVFGYTLVAAGEKVVWLQELGAAVPQNCASHYYRYRAAAHRGGA